MRRRERESPGSGQKKEEKKNRIVDNDDDAMEELNQRFAKTSVGDWFSPAKPSNTFNSLRRAGINEFGRTNKPYVLLEIIEKDGKLNAICESHGFNVAKWTTAIQLRDMPMGMVSKDSVGLEKVEPKKSIAAMLIKFGKDHVFAPCFERGEDIGIQYLFPVKKDTPLDLCMISIQPKDELFPTPFKIIQVAHPDNFPVNFDEIGIVIGYADDFNTEVRKVLVKKNKDIIKCCICSSTAKYYEEGTFRLLCGESCQIKK